MEIRSFDGDRGSLRLLFRLAEDSEDQIDRYLLAGEIIVAVMDAEVLGYVQLLDAQADGVAELKSMAVIGAHQRSGVGRALVEEAVRRSRSRGASQLVVATAAAGTGNLRFYQRMHFRMLRIERDAFGPGLGYAEGTVIDGIPLRDRVWLEREL
jgi:ribosomal protein S18 acetylase RimI-like enzyme